MPASNRSAGKGVAGRGNSKAWPLSKLQTEWGSAYKIPAFHSLGRLSLADGRLQLHKEAKPYLLPGANVF